MVSNSSTWATGGNKSFEALGGPRPCPRASIDACGKVKGASRLPEGDLPLAAYRTLLGTFRMATRPWSVHQQGDQRYPAVRRREHPLAERVNGDTIGTATSSPWRATH